MIPFVGFSQQSKLPVIINDSIKFEKDDLVKINDPYQLYLKPVQYIGIIKDTIRIKFEDFIAVNPRLKKNYIKQSGSINTIFYNKKLEGIEIQIDNKQTTPIFEITYDYLNVSVEDLATIELYIDFVNNGKKSQMDSLNSKLSKITLNSTISNIFDGFPVIITNTGKASMPIGFGNHVPLELEILDKNNIWKKVYGFRRYRHPTGIELFVLKQNEIAVIFEPRLEGNVKGKFRYRLANIVSNVFEGSIDEQYLPKEEPNLISVK